MSKTDERIMILKMVEKGKIDADEAAKLLEALESGESKDKHSHKEAHKEEESSGKWFRIRVSDSITGEQKTNIRIPVGLMNAGLNIGAQFSPEIAGMKSEQLKKLIKERKIGLLMDVMDDDDGEHVEIFIE